MSNIKVITDLLLQGKCVLLPSECGWGLSCSAKSSSAIKELIEISSGFRKGDEVLLIESSNVLYDYMTEVPEMAFTLLDIAGQPLILSIEQWIAISPLNEVFANGISFRIDESKLITDLIRFTKSDLVFIPLFTNAIESVSSDLIDKIIAYSESPFGLTAKVTSPGIIKFFANGAFKILRE